MRVVWRSFLLELDLARRGPGHLLIVVVAAMQATTMLALALANDRPDAVVNAVLAPGLTGLWIAALNLAGEVIAGERWGGRLELLVATPAPLALIVFGRVLAVVLFGGLTFVEAWLIAAFGFGQVVPIASPAAFVLGVLVTGFAMAGTATLLASAFVLSRALDVLKNSLSYPFYVLGGVFVPIVLLPGWIQPLSKPVFLSWSADVLRAALRGEPAAPGAFGVILLLGAVALAAGIFLTRSFVDRLRREGSVGHA